MKLTKLFTLVTLATILFASCSDSKKSKLANVIPADAITVVNIDTKSLIAKSEYDAFENITIKRAIGALKAQLSKDEAQKILDAFTKDINSLGIDLKDECYIFTNQDLVGVVLGVNDAPKIKQVIDNLSGSSAEDIIVENDIYTMNLNSRATVCWDKEKFLFLTNLNYYSYRYSEDEKEPIEVVAKKLMTQSEKESINGKPEFAEFLRGKQDISLFGSTSLSIYQKMAKEMGVDAQILENFKVLNDVKSFSYFSFVKGEVQASSKMYYTSTDAEKQFNELSAQICGKIKGDQLKYAPQNPIAMLSTNMKGEGIYNLIQKFDVSNQFQKEFSHAELGMELDEFIKLFDGDFTIFLDDLTRVTKTVDYGYGNPYEYQINQPIFGMLVDTKDGKKLLNAISTKLVEETGAKKVDDNTYSFSDNNNAVVYYIGVRNNTFFVTNSQATLDKLNGQNPTNSHSSLIKNNIVILTGRIDKLQEVAKGEFGNNILPIVNEGLLLTENYEVTVSDDLVGTGKIRMSNKDKNSFASICKYIDNVLTFANDQLPF